MSLNLENPTSLSFSFRESETFLLPKGKSYVLTCSIGPHSKTYAQFMVTGNKINSSIFPNPQKVIENPNFPSFCPLYLTLKISEFFPKNLYKLEKSEKQNAIFEYVKSSLLVRAAASESISCFKPNYLGMFQPDEKMSIAVTLDTPRKYKINVVPRPKAPEHPYSTQGTQTFMKKPPKYSETHPIHSSQKSQIEQRPTFFISSYSKAPSPE